MKKRKVSLHSSSEDVSPNAEADSMAWQHNPQAQTLRVDLQNGVFFVFPYSHFVFSHFTPDPDGEELYLLFSSHSIRIVGQHLRDLGIALQRLAVEWIREMPVRYNYLVGKEGAFVIQIEVTEINEGLVATKGTDGV